jgi:type IV pilus assembly protein PilA
MAALTVACSKKYAPRPISSEAAAAFARAEVTGMGGSLVIDAEVLRELGFQPRAEETPNGDFLLDLLVRVLPAFAAEMKDDPAAPILARTAVLLGLVREWAIAPHAQRLGIVVAMNPANPAAFANDSLVLLAVKEGEEENRALIQGLGAAVRAASGRPLVATENGDLCVAREAVPEVPFQVCLRPGPGFIALGTAEVLATLAEPSTPGRRESGPALRLVVSVPAQGRGELLVEGHGELRVSGTFEPEDPKLAETVEEGAKKLLQMADAQRAKSRLLLAGALKEVQASVAADAEAPDRMKSAVAGATAEQLLDPRGEYAAIRRSVRITRDGKAVRGELTVPEDQVRRFARIDQGMVTTVATVGILSAIAIPGFIKYQCRSKASEARVVLATAREAMEEYRAEHGAYAGSLQLAGYAPASRGRYAVCTRTGCVPRGAAAEEACAEALGATAEEKGSAPALCAAGEIDGSPDVWVIDASGAPAAVRSACQ